MAVIQPEGYLQHYGIGGMKWGIRRYQNLDGSLTEEGKRRYGDSTKGRAKMYTEAIRSQTNMQRTAMTEQKRRADLRARRVEAKERILSDTDYYSNNASTSSSKIDRKVKRLDKAMAKDTMSIMANQTLIDNSRAIVNELIREAMKNNYSISSKDVTRGKNIIAKIFGGSPTTVTEYKVKKTKYST